ncbi:transmembrane protein, putative [Bodo saltans]|uniref:Transmembrane protein, putative n=1 Tax=Bodo saltans TaxID=75058 RepID=A0A0S4J1J8_BODSA|nr:transmembrane protein, putative [Bodo saltans]|eukprot:CUG82041.1 transmembrane protein, putative [Bodo saltans]
MNMKQKKLSSHLNPLKNKKETVSPILRSLGNVFHLAVVYRAFRQVSRFARRRHVVFYLALFFFPAAFLTFVDLHFVLGVHVVPKGLFKRLEEPVAHQVFVTLHDTTHVRRVSN